MFTRTDPENPGRLSRLAATHGQAAGQAVHDSIAVHSGRIELALYFVAGVLLAILAALTGRPAR